MRLTWTDIATARADSAHGEIVEVAGFPASPGTAGHAAYFMLLAEAACCAGHIPRHPAAAVEVFAAAPLPLRAGRLRLHGSWRVQADGAGGWRYQLHDARALDPPGWPSVTRLGVTRPRA